MLAGLANFLLATSPNRCVFLVGVLPAFVVLWIRRAVPEPEEWQGAKERSRDAEPVFRDLFRGPVRKTTLLTLGVCGLSLTGHWAFLFWYLQHLRNLSATAGLSDADQSHLVSKAVWLVMLTSIAGNFFAAWIARQVNYRRAIVILCLGYFLAIAATYSSSLGYNSPALWWGFAAIGVCQGIFALFTMYLPPLYPTLLRTTGAGFCYNFGRIAAGVGTVFFGLFSKVGDFRLALFYAGFLFLPAAVIAWFLPDGANETVEPAKTALEDLQ